MGEAQNPGPRRAHFVPRNPLNLQAVSLVEPATGAIQHRVWNCFEVWLQASLSPTARAEAFLCPSLVVLLLEKYGLHLYSSGKGLYELRHLLVVAQQRYPWLKAHMAPAWQVVSRWEVLQPVRHRTPLHFSLFKAMVSLALAKRWFRWAATVSLGFYGIARISEVLKAKRMDLLLPSDQFGLDFPAAFLKVRNPKTKRRGRGRVQHLKIQDPMILRFLETVFASLDPTLSLFPLSAASFRSRWEKLLDELFIPAGTRPTPASIRGGGCILAYQQGEDISNLMWRMRVSNQSTLEHYLQEMAADSVMNRLPEMSTCKVKTAALLFPLLMEHSVS